MDIAEIVLVAVNLVLGFGFSIPLARFLTGLKPRPHGFVRYFIMFIGIYFLECVAIVAAMLLPVFSIGLAFVWGIIFGLWLREKAPAHRVLKISFSISLYSSFPAASFILVPLIGLFTGWNIISSEEGIRFGIPDFLYSPLSTILGFYTALSIGLIIIKTTITAGVVSLFIHLKQRPEDS